MNNVLKTLCSFPEFTNGKGGSSGRVEPFSSPYGAVGAYILSRFRVNQVDFD
jgi:hypothetical protein